MDFKISIFLLILLVVPNNAPYADKLKTKAICISVICFAVADTRCYKCNQFGHRARDCQDTAEEGKTDLLIWTSPFPFLF